MMQIFHIADGKEPELPPLSFYISLKTIAPDAQRYFGAAIA
jgi:hypothetical protein